MSPPALVPIRVDAWSADRTIRVVDTLLLDPVCWPVQPAAGDVAADADVDAAASALVEANTQYLADSILSDVEVMGMGRADRPAALPSPPPAPSQPLFTGRQSLWNFSLQQRLCDQIRGQLWRALLATAPRRPRPGPADAGRKRPAPGNEEGTGADEAAAPHPKRQRTDDAPGAAVGEAGAAAAAAHPPASSAANAPRDPVDASGPPGGLVPVRVRLSAFGVRVQDDLEIDPALDTSPLVVARSVARDLRLNDDVAVAVAVDIAEQLHGLQPAPGPVPPAYDAEQGGLGPTAEADPHRPRTAAYRLDQRVHISNVAQAIAEHKA